MSEHRFLKVSVDDGVARVVLNRPPLNIFTTEMVEELNRVLEGLSGEPALRALVLAAEGKAFSAGVAVEDHLGDRVAPMLEAFLGTFRLLRSVGVPTVSAVQGPALGGGCELACFADLVIASEAATFGQPEIRLGTIAPLAALHLPSRIGLPRTLQLLLSGDVIRAEEAVRIGLVDQVVPPERLTEAVEGALAKFRDKSSPALRYTKEAVLSAMGLPFEEALERVKALCLEELTKTEDAAEGLRSFLEKRPPVWQHR
ncbi:MAG: enoyl-CoA hydratase/isomerase family protein [Deltaproteobacteria bacterium]|nr:enoyl-CoA hydratase/isomerase family protein [Deltaproteobacteria bacterium]